jgi:uncharacterized protein YabN with tetrapyrrole methylase and pyrophosphatase domain
MSCQQVDICRFYINTAEFACNETGRKWHKRRHLVARTHTTRNTKGAYISSGNFKPT